MASMLQHHALRVPLLAFFICLLAVPEGQAKYVVNGMSFHLGGERSRRLPFHSSGFGGLVGLRIDTAFPETFPDEVQRYEIYGRFGLPNVGGYFSMPTVAIVAGDTGFGMGNLELGAYYDLQLTKNQALVFSLGAALPTASGESRMPAAHALAALTRMTDSVLHLQDTLSARLSISSVTELQVTHKLGFFLRFDAGLDVPFDAGDKSPVNDGELFYLRLNAGLGINYSLLTLLTEFVNVGQLGKQSPDGAANKFAHEAVITLSALVPVPQEFGFVLVRPYLSTTVGIDDNVKNAIKAAFTFGLEVGFH